MEHPKRDTAEPLAWSGCLNFCCFFSSLPYWKYSISAQIKKWFCWKSSRWIFRDKHSQLEEHKLLDSCYSVSFCTHMNTHTCAAIREKTRLGVSFNLAGLICSIWAWGSDAPAKAINCYEPRRWRLDSSSVWQRPWPTAQPQLQQSRMLFFLQSSRSFVFFFPADTRWGEVRRKVLISMATTDTEIHPRAQWHATFREHKHRSADSPQLHGFPHLAHQTQSSGRCDCSDRTPSQSNSSTGGGRRRRQRNHTSSERD